MYAPPPPPPMTTAPARSLIPAPPGSRLGQSRFDHHAGSIPAEEVSSVFERPLVPAERGPLDQQQGRAGANAELQPLGLGGHHRLDPFDRPRRTLAVVPFQQLVERALQISVQ